MVSAEGIESALQPQTKNLTEHSWRFKRVQVIGEEENTDCLSKASVGEFWDFSELGCPQDSSSAEGKISRWRLSQRASHGLCRNRSRSSTGSRNHRYYEAC